MKKFLLLFPLLLLINACSDEGDNSNKTTQEIATKEIQMFSLPSTDIINSQFSFSANDADSVFANKNEIINAINNVIKCTLSPQNQTCKQATLPKFILMEDESLQRPTQIQYKITQIKPLAGGLLHIHTQSQCNNNWFGLCQGNIIYVLQNQNNSWFVSDIFALESTK